MQHVIIPSATGDRSRMYREIRKLQFTAAAKRNSSRAPSKPTAADIYGRIQDAVAAARLAYDAYGDAEDAAIDEYPDWPEDLYITVSAGPGESGVQRIKLTREYIEHLQSGHRLLTPRVKQRLGLLDQHMATIDAVRAAQGVPEADAAASAASDAVIELDKSLVAHQSAGVADLAAKLRRLTELMDDAGDLEPDSQYTANRFYGRMVLACLADAERLARKGGSAS